jgi:phage terminase large subunit-like protein
LLFETLTNEKTRRLTENRLAYYQPYEKQRQFHAAGAHARERLLMAGNQLGKTLAGGMETAMHMTGRYPPWWQGKRFDRPVVGWICGRSDEDVRDGMQRILLGRPGEIGTGTIPKDAILDLVSARGIPGLNDMIRVQHVSGGASIAATKSYKAGRESFQGETLDFCSLDEEPPAEVYTECLTRTNIGSGPVWLTFTPLLGMSEVVRRFLLEKNIDRNVTQMAIDDVDHYSDEEKRKIISSYPAHEVEARTKGIPILGSGRIFPVSEERIVIEHRDIPPHWPRIGGMDFGWDHPFAAVELAWDREGDTVYVLKTHRLKEATPVVHAGAVRSWGKELPWAWPRDGRRETLEGAGIALAEQYREQGLNLTYDHAQFEDGSVSVEAGIMKMLSLMQGGKFKVFKHLNDWWEEFRLYHRKDGKVVKEGDDLMAATRYAVMMLRYAKTKGEYDSFRRVIKYPKFGAA